MPSGNSVFVFLLEGKVLESPHGQGCGQALPGERAGVRPARKMRGQAEAPSEVGFRGQVGTCQSAIQTPPLEVGDHSSHSLL